MTIYQHQEDFLLPYQNFVFRNWSWMRFDALVYLSENHQSSLLFFWVSAGSEDFCHFGGIVFHQIWIFCFLLSPSQTDPANWNLDLIWRARSDHSYQKFLNWYLGFQYGKQIHPFELILASTFFKMDKKIKYIQ